MLECPNCRQGFQAGAHFCGACGTSLLGVIPAVVSQNSGNGEPLASGQDAPGFQAKDSPEDTLVRKKPAGLPWQPQRTTFPADEPSQISGRVSVDAEGITISQIGSARLLNDMVLPTIPVTPLLPPQLAPTPSVLPPLQATHGGTGTPAATSFAASGNSAVSAVSDLAGAPSVSGGIARIAKAAGEHVSFAIPVRPNRFSPHSTADQRPLEAADEVTAFALLARLQTAESPGDRTMTGLSDDRGEIPVDNQAFATTVQENTLDLHASSRGVEAVVAPVSSGRPLDETLIVPDFLARLSSFAPAASGAPETAIFAPAMEAFVEPGLPGTMVEMPSFSPPVSVPTVALMPLPTSIPSVSLEEDEPQIPTTPAAQRAVKAETRTPDEPSAAAQVEESEEDESQIPTVPAMPAGEGRASIVQSPASVSPEASELDSVAFFAPFFKPSEVPAHLLQSADPYLHLKQELAAQRVEITAAMDELLPLVYDNHREENEALFISILAHRPPLDDEAWGHAAFVLGAYGNYMYRHPLPLAKKLEIWRAQLWAVYYERSYRRKYLAQRCQQLIHFFQGCTENSTFLAVALHDLETLYLYLEPGSLRKLQQMLQTLATPPADLLQLIEAQLVVAEREKAERMARQLTLAQPKPSSSMPPEANKPATQPEQTTVNKSVVPPVEKKPVVQPGKGEANKPAAQLGQGGANKSAGSKQSAQPVANRSGMSPAGSKPAVQPGQTGASRPAVQAGANKLVAQVDQTGGQESYRWPGFWSEEQRRLFFASLRADHLEAIHQLLLQTRKQILAALRTELLNTNSLNYQRPRKSVPMRLGNRYGVEHDRFAEAFRLLSSQKLKDQQAALRLFEQNLHENIKQEYEQGAREWMLYARACVQGSTRVAHDWESAFKRDEASWEEIWNLAYYHRKTNDLPEAIRVLAPGLDELDAPISHLRLALICALTLLLEPGQAGLPVLQSARNLLIRHLERWPHPLSCLAWLALSYEAPGTLRPLDQSKRLSVVQELLEYPVDLPDPRVDLMESQIKALEDVLVNKTHCEEAWFLWLNDYAARHPHNFPTWTWLAETSERMERRARAEAALQHIAGIYYDLDYVYAQEGEEEVQAATELRSHVEKLFEFYRRHEMQRQAWDSFESCYATLNHLGFWDEQKSANRKLLTLVAPFLMEYRRQEARRQEVQQLAEVQDTKSRSETVRNDVSNNPTRPLEHFKSDQRVGIFVDYENIARLIPRESDMEGVWQGLASYAAQFGEVVCRWASASPRNLSNLTAVRTGLEAAQFKIRYPRRELQFSASQKDLADYALLECINTASLNDHLDVYLVVSGDRDYYERIYSLLESGRVVHILASECNLSTSYRELEQQRQRQHKEAGEEESDFFIDNLDEVLSSLPPISH